MAFQLFFLHLMFICPPRLQKTQKMSLLPSVLNCIEITPLHYRKYYHFPDQDRKKNEEYERTRMR